jgi:RND family efflux transporter MFP subunit
MASKPRKWVILIPILAGIAAVVVMKQNKLTPVQATIQETPKLVRSIAVPQLDVIPKASGFGTVRPSRSWEAVAQVKGKIVEKNARLQKGAILEAGTQLLKIDPTDYQLAIAQTEADIQAAEAQLLELQAKERNTRASLRIEQEALTLGEKELERKRSLIGKGGISRSDLDTQERTLLAQQQSVQTQKNSLNLIPSERSLLEAQLARYQVQLQTAHRNLAHSEINLPFTGRISEVNVEQDQYVREGEILTIADDLQSAEVEVQIPIERMSDLFYSGQTIDVLGSNQQDLANRLDISAGVHLEEGALSASWQARFARMSDTLDTKTRTVGVIVEVDNPYDQVQPGIRPPLVKGLFVEVLLAGKPRLDSLVIPRSALHDDKVYLINQDNRLEIRPVKISLTQPEYLVVSEGLSAGDRIVSSDLIPAIEGMLLQPIDDPESLEQLKQSAISGEI